MSNKYWVPALERAQEILELISRQQGKLKMADINRQLSISKSTLFNLLLTLEDLGWIEKDQQDRYLLGLKLGIWGNAYFQQFDLVNLFNKEALGVKNELNESVQLAKLEGNQVLYLAKIGAQSQVQMVSGPGSRMPAHSTGLGKLLLSSLDEQSVFNLYPQEELAVLTPHTLSTRTQLLQQFAEIRSKGYAIDLQEGVMGFCCVAAPVYDLSGTMNAAVSVSVPIHNWEAKFESVKVHTLMLGRKLSMTTE